MAEGHRGKILMIEKSPEGAELCRMAIAKATEETSDWVNTVVGYYYKFQPHHNEEPFYAGMAITERLLANFINYGDMPESDMDLPVGFTKKAREAHAERAREFFEKFPVAKPQNESETIMSETNVRYVAGDVVYSFADGDKVVNTLNFSDVEEVKYISAQHGGLAKLEYCGANGRLYNVREVLEAHPELLENNND